MEPLLFKIHPLFSTKIKIISFIIKQECIPVGCVPPACLAHLVVPGGGVRAWEVCMPGGMHAPRGCACPGACMPGGMCAWRHACLTSPPVDRQTPVKT